ncbi:gamma-glutamyltransferase family protein [Limibaculum sp. FT325]|uniref:gamma-glutamyltransferase n=1 Tax=Thermohalobaculum sediminis TaxID=2939436 RepID=UPI0020BE1834|nr:gamma-glutamyltransferase [Limibaculum sediminis]MCL5776822.1 gamma-glutamyltransferase family protein [Limibaculum sediminis]
MSSNFSRTQQVRKAVIETPRGVVAAQHRRAAEIGAEVLAAGGDAVDAAVAVSFAIGVVEPWMSGPAGGGAMMVWRAAEGRAHAVNYGMRSPAGLDPADYPLAGTGPAGDLFPWEAVVGERNVLGATAVAVPGLVDGVGLAHGRFGRMPWRDLVQPAIGLAREGLLVDWYAALIIASATRALARDSDAAAMFLEDGQWPPIAGWTSLAQKRVAMDRMADTLDRLAEKGPREFFDGDVGRALAADVEAKGGALRFADLNAYRARIEEPLAFEHRGAQFFATPGLTAGPTLRDALAALAETPAARPDGVGFAAIGDALKAAYARRLTTMGAEDEAAGAPACTTHFSVVDREGNMVALTQTLLSIFGARCVSPSTGLLLNNGIMWFDPVQGGPNSLGPGKACLMNVCPVIGEAGGARFALGASGGRKIVSAVTQLSAFIADWGMDLEQAFHHPRIDVSGGEVVAVDDTLPAETIAAIEARHPVMRARRTVYPYAFACPAGVMRRDGLNTGATEIMSPWGDAVTEPEGDRT